MVFIAFLKINWTHVCLFLDSLLCFIELLVYLNSYHTVLIIVDLH